MSVAQQTTYKPSFLGELKRLTDVRGYTTTRVASLIGCDVAYLEHVRLMREPASEGLATAADRVLRANGSLLSLWRDDRRLVRTPDGGGGQADEELPPEIMIECDETSLQLRGDTYVVRRRRRITNTGEVPLFRISAKITVDRLPGSAARSLAVYAANPLTWTELKLRATCDGRRSMRCVVREDGMAYKEFWLLFEDEAGSFPVSSGETATLEYEYQVSRQKWGNWLQRTVGTPTREMRVELSFPERADTTVWGSQICGTAAALPFKQPLVHSRGRGHDHYAWSVSPPHPNGTYRIEWRFGAEKSTDEGEFAPLPTARETMRLLGIVQHGDPGLREHSLPFEFPREALYAQEVAAKLGNTMERLSNVHTFSKGMGLAAPQIGINRAAACVRLPDGEEITFFNPKVLDADASTDDQLEGCLSFFDVRGSVPRPLTISFAYHDAHGCNYIRSLERGKARLVSHEIDHLSGILYIDKMRPDSRLVPVNEYNTTGEVWRY